jgi:hypothetical protein
LIRHKDFQASHFPVALSLVPEELSNRINNLLIPKPNQRFGFSLAPTLAPDKKVAMVRVPNQAKGWIRNSKSSPFDQSRSFGSRRTIWPFIGMTESVS